MEIGKKCRQCGGGGGSMEKNQPHFGFSSQQTVAQEKNGCSACLVPSDLNLGRGGEGAGYFW